MGDLIQRRTSLLHFWAAIGSNVLHAITSGIMVAAVAGLFAQFVLFIIPWLAIAYCLLHSVVTFNQTHWIAVGVFQGQF